MMSTQLIDFFDNFITDDLVYIESENLKNVRRILNQLPDECMYYLLCYELKFIDNIIGLDFFCGASLRNPHGIELFEGLVKKYNENLNESNLGLKICSKTLEYMKQFQSSSLIDHIWLEYDAFNNPENKLTPGIFWGLVPEKYTNFVKFEELIQVIRDLIMPFEIDDNTIEVLLKIFNLTENKQGITHLGLMTSRQNNFRILINNLKIDNICTILKAFNREESTQIKMLYDNIYRFFDYYSLQLEIDGSGITSDIGFECYQFNRPHKYRKILSKLTLSKLVENKYIKAEYIEDILKFENIKSINQTNNIKLKKYGISGNILDQKIHHYKFNINKDNIKFKIYLSSELNWMKLGD
jgi:hypothetical protein